MSVTIVGVLIFPIDLFNLTIPPLLNFKMEKREGRSEVWIKEGEIKKIKTIVLIRKYFSITMLRK